MSEPVKLAAKPLLNPLGEEDRMAIEHVLARLPQIRDLIDRAEACGLDMGERRAKHEVHHAIATRIQSHFFPPELPAVSE